MKAGGVGVGAPEQVGVIGAVEVNAWRGIFGQRNECAAICTLFLTLGLHYQTSGLMSQFIRGSVLLLSVIFIIMSGSRTGWILAALALISFVGSVSVARFRVPDSDREPR